MTGDADNGTGGSGGGENRGGAIPRTVFSPMPGGQPPPGISPLPRTSELGALEAESSRPGVNRLVDAAADLFDLVVYLRSQNTPVEIGPLREKAIALIDQFERRALSENEEANVVATARYAIAATIDDQVMSRPWGLDSGWQQRKIVDVLYGEVIGGEKFFEYLEAARKNPARFQHLIEFFYICLSLGFRGRYRRDRSSGGDGLEKHRKAAFATIEQQRGGAFADRLALRWRGVDTTRRPVRDLLPTWLLAALSAAMVAGLFVLFLYLMADHTAESEARVAALPPGTVDGQRVPVRIARLAAPTPPPEIKLKPPRLERVRTFLEPEIEEGLVEVFEDAGEVRIRLIGDGMFRSAEIDVLPRYLDVLERVAAALNDEPGDVVIEGHTDSIQPRKTAKYPTNQILSKARAEAVRDIILPSLAEPGRVTIEGYGATRAIAGNDTREDRARNRRVELLLIRDPAGYSDATDREG
ncbi:MAG: type IVB secretion system protein IcmH/DotU [Pseudomonadota bacterium]